MLSCNCNGRDLPFVLDRPTHTDGHEQALLGGRFGVTQSMGWAKLLKRVFEFDLEHCPNCGGELKIIAVIL